MPVGGNSPKNFSNGERGSALTELDNAKKHIDDAIAGVNTAAPQNSGGTVTDPVVDALDKAKARITVALIDLGGKPCGGGRPC
jgi:hypothetical protein